MALELHRQSTVHRLTSDTITDQIGRKGVPALLRMNRKHRLTLLTSQLLGNGR